LRPGERVFLENPCVALAADVNSLKKLAGGTRLARAAANFFASVSWGIRDRGWLVEFSLMDGLGVMYQRVSVGGW
jgi:hypothetical protein